MSTFILTVSIFFQFIAAGLALRLIRSTGHKIAWGCIALALILMGIRRSITWYRMASGDLTMPVDPAAESVALIISALMLAGVILIGHLFSEIRENEKAFEGALADAKRANKVKSEFLATMSHEFRTPLNAILGFSEMLSAPNLPPLGANSYREYANDIHVSGEHMLELVDDILDITALEAGRRPMVKEAVAVAELLAECIRKVEQAANERGIDLSLVVPDNSPSLYADKRSVTQIVLNVLSNAIKYTNKNGKISVSARAEDLKMRIRVIDSGIGIPADKLKSVTERFFQTNSDPHIAETGTGLGLSIVKSLVAANDAELDIESEIGRGTTVTVTFPSQEALLH